MYRKIKSISLLCLVFLLPIVQFDISSPYRTTAGPVLSVADAIPGVIGQPVNVPVVFETGGDAVSSASFTVDFDETRLGFEETGGVTCKPPAGFTCQWDYNPNVTNGELDFEISDTISPFLALPAGELVSIVFTPSTEGDAKINFTQFTFLDTSQQPLLGTVENGSVLVAPKVNYNYMPFVAKRYPLLYSIYGRVTLYGNGMSGVSVSLNTGASNKTDANGYYEFEWIPPATYTLTPKLSGYNFSPPSRTVSLPPDNYNVDFVAAPIPTPTPPPPVCYEYISNSGFESGPGPWQYVPAPIAPFRTSERSYNGSYSGKSGTTDPFDFRAGFSTIYQEVTIPSDADSAVLSYYLLPKTTEPIGTVTSDSQLVQLRRSDGSLIVTLRELLSDNNNWISFTDNLIGYAGRTIRIAFDTKNDGYDGVTAMYVDQVSLMVCR